MVAWEQHLCRPDVLSGRVGDLPGGALEGADELPADDLALALRVGHAGQRGHERPGLVRHRELDAGGGDEVVLDLFGLTLAQQAMVDEHAGQAVTAGALHERGGDRRVHAAAYPATGPA